MVLSGEARLKSEVTGTGWSGIVMLSTNIDGLCQRDELIFKPSPKAPYGEKGPGPKPCHSIIGIREKVVASPMSNPSAFTRCFSHSTSNPSEKRSLRPYKTWPLTIGPFF